MQLYPGATTSIVKKIFRSLAVCGLVAATHAASPLPHRDYVEGEVIVTFKESVNLEEATRALAARQLKFAQRFARLADLRQKHLGLVRAPGRTTMEMIAALKNDPAVEVAEPNFLRRPCGGTPNDPRFTQLWGLHNTGQIINGVAGAAGHDIKFADAWSLARRSTNPIVVAVIDSGVDATHPDLVANLWTNPGETPDNLADDDGNGYVDDIYGYDFAEGDSNPAPASLHGTHVAGTIAATGNNQVGVIGVNYQARIMALKVATAADPQSFPDAAILAAMDYCVMMQGRGVNLVAINASWGEANFSSALRAGIQAVGDAGIIFCAAAGNSSGNNDVAPFYPAAFGLPNLIAVAASDQNDGLASFSNFGASTVDLAAPGVNIFSTIPVMEAGTTASVQRASTIYLANQLTYSGLTTGITTNLYDCGLGYPTNFPAEVHGNLALIARGTLFFSEKVANAMAAGASAAVIYNNVGGTFLGTLQYSNNWIPAIAITQADGLALKAALPASVTVANAIDPAQVYGYASGTSMATPHVVGAVAFAAMNFPEEDVAQRIQRVVANAESVAGLQGKVRNGARLNLQRLVDTDVDGLPDWWEKAQFGNLTAPEANADPDLDGAPNLAEWLAGTDPLNPSSAFRILTAARTGDDVRVTWTTVGGHSYQLQAATTAVGSWATNFVDLGAAIPVGGTNESTTNYLHLGGAMNTAGYYRVRQF